MSSSSPVQRLLRVPVAVALLGVSATAAHAAPEVEVDTVERDQGAEARARAAYDRGAQAYAEARFSDALAAFQEASALMASPDFLFNIGLCYEQLGRYQDATRTFEAYLAAHPDAADAAAIAARIERLQRSARQQTEAARVREAESAGTLESPGDGGSEPPRTYAPLLGVGIATLVVGAGVAAAGIAPSLTAARSNKAIDDVNAGNPSGNTAPQVREFQAASERARIQQIALFAAGGALTVAGAVMTTVAVRRRRARVRATASLMPSFAGISVGGAF